jgi:uncharacterized protein YaaN involved in tellurite resistance
MKEKTSTISKDLRATIDRSAGSAQRDIERINRAADELNSEAEDVLRYQSRGLASRQRSHRPNSPRSIAP